MGKTTVEIQKGSVGFLGLLQLLLIALKIMGYIQASWLVVLIPMFFSVSLTAIVVAVAFFIMLKSK